MQTSTREKWGKRKGRINLNLIEDLVKMFTLPRKEAISQGF
jgi:hypothetical protein